MLQEKTRLDNRKIAFLTLGCKVNSYETEAMQHQFREAGAVIVDFDEKAEAYIINTCAVTQIADRKSRQMLHRAKKQNQEAVVVAVGCYAQEAGAALLEDGAVDLVIGNNLKSEAVLLVTKALEAKSMEAGGNEKKPEGTECSHVLDLSAEADFEPMQITEISEKTRAYIKIQDGCNQFCSYCIIPYVRGRIRSRAPEEILSEVRGLTQKGYREIVLTGIHLSSYGRTAKDRGTLDGTALAGLILALDKIEGLARIRLGSLEPRIITPEFVYTLKGAQKLCPHFHLSLQSGCDATLRRMNRKYTAQEYAKACELLRQEFDRPAITTDVIAGFPGETEEEFQETLQFLSRIRFAQMHVFRYSVRKGTAAERLPNQVPEPVKAARSEKLIALEQQLRTEYLQSMLGEQEEILTEDLEIIDGKEYRTGHSMRYVKYITEAETAENVLFTGKVQELRNGNLLYLK